MAALPSDNPNAWSAAMLKRCWPLTAVEPQCSACGLKPDSATSSQLCSDTFGLDATVAAAMQFELQPQLHSDLWLHNCEMVAELA